MHDENLYKEIKKWKKIAVSLTLFVVISVVSTVSFVLGRKSADSNLQSVPLNDTDQRFILGSEAKSETSDSPTPSHNLTSTPTKKPQPIPSVAVKEIVLSAESHLDGFRSSNGSGSVSSNIRAGRDNELVTRAFVSFDITGLPEDAEIVSAELRIFQTKTLGNPYKAGGILFIDHLNYGDGLDGSDFSAPALLSNFSKFSEKPTTGWVKSDVSDQVINDLVSARPLSQFRLHFEEELIGGDENGDFAYFESTENTQRSGNTPELVVEYTLN